MYSVDEDRLGENIKTNVYTGILRIRFSLISHRNHPHTVTNKLLHNVFPPHTKK